MNILLVSECSGNAIKETRRILDQFAERRGERTWQTAITANGLDTLQALLRKTARKNTAVACHWIRGINHTELAWIVGDKNRFNSVGAVPTNITKQKMPRAKDENNWHTLQDIYLISGISALYHDIGKACDAFQGMLTAKNGGPKNIFRHEWVSLRLFEAFVGDDSDDKGWLERLASPSEVDQKELIKKLHKDGLEEQFPPPFAHLPPIARAVGWLILTHHRLPTPPEWSTSGLLDKIPGAITHEWHQKRLEHKKSEIKPYWTFSEGLPITSAMWAKQARRLSGRLLTRISTSDETDMLATNPFVMHLSRLSLMLGDHAYSAADANPGYGDKDSRLFANTDRKTRELKQHLDEHLYGVAHMVGQVTHALPILTNDLPKLARHRGLRQRSVETSFQWQNKAMEAAYAIRDKTAADGAFIVNMASTGTGKTLANARVMYALSPDVGMRCAFALGLRVLTLQTGKEYRERLRLSDRDAAMCLGGTPNVLLFQRAEDGVDVGPVAILSTTTDDYEGSQPVESGSESESPLLDDGANVVYGAPIRNLPMFDNLLRDPQARDLLMAPMLVCTVDQLAPATESIRGGHQILPMLRLLSGDLVLDELDDYDIDDLPALTRLVHWAGLLGSRVLISSATLPPALVIGMFAAYREGRAEFQRNRGESPDAVLSICTLWVDEFGIQSANCIDGNAFTKMHDSFTKKRSARLSHVASRRKCELIPLAPSLTSKHVLAEAIARQIADKAQVLHSSNHSVDPQSRKRVSFGLVRMANIRPLFDVAVHLSNLEIEANLRIHLCVYHSRFPLILRSEIESRLDKVLNRKDPGRVFKLPEVRCQLDNTQEADQIFLVLGSPITEVGRDHDYDWAIVEPSSMRSLIQLAGRVRRHRFEEYDKVNILLFRQNVRSIETPGQPAYTWPGFEDAAHRLVSHDLLDILRPEELAIDSRPRITSRETLSYANSLVDLEHVRLQETMLCPPRRVLDHREKVLGESDAPPLGAYTWWAQPFSMLAGALQVKQRFRKQTQPEVELMLLPSREASSYDLVMRQHKSGRLLASKVESSMHVHIKKVFRGQNIQPWTHTGYFDAICELAESLDMDLVRCAERFGVLSVPESRDGLGWESNECFGFVNKVN